MGKLSLSFLIVAGVALAGKKIEDFLLTSPHFRISEVSFKGLNSLEKKTLESLAKVEMGKNMFQVDLGEIRRRLQNHPQVKEVVISRQFPQRMEVRIKEREAIALIKNDGKLYPVDSEGFIVFRDSRPRSLPLITGLGIRGRKVGERIEEAKLVMALGILETSASSGLLISAIDLEGRNPVLWTRGIKILLEGGENREEKIKECKSILTDLRRRRERVEYIDLRFNNPVVKLR